MKLEIRRYVTVEGECGGMPYVKRIPATDALHVWNDATPDNVRTAHAIMRDYSEAVLMMDGRAIFTV